MSSGEDRTEEATPRRRAKSLSQGMSPQSALAASAFVLVASAAPALAFARYLPQWPDEFRSAVIAAASAVHAPSPDIVGLGRDVLISGHAWNVAVVAWIAALIAAVAVAHACGALGFRPVTLKPTFGHSGVPSLRRIASSQTLIQAAGSGVAVSVVATLVAPIAVNEVGSLATIRDFAAQAGIAVHACEALWSSAVAALAIIAVIDLAVQRRRHASAIKMSPRELREERAQTEGRPETKHRRRAVAARRARGLHISAIRRATAVITNPTHLAIALRYAPPDIDVPVVVARGADLMAVLVRTIAQTCDVPVVESAELAWMLYWRVDAGEPIPEECYAAVAAVFTWILRTRGALRRGDEDDP